MKKILLKLLGVLVLPVLLLTGCDKWLEVRPSTEVPEDFLFQNEQGFFEALSGVYINMAKPQLYGRELTIGLVDVMGAQYNTPGAYNAAYSYRYTEMLGAINGIWTSMYKNIGNVNVILANIDNKKDAFSGVNYELAKGQALGLRVFLHFDLYRLFAPSPFAGASGPTLPYITEFKPSVKSRLSEREFLQACHRDLDEALVLLSKDRSISYTNNANPFYSYVRNRFNYYAALALKARIALYEGNKEMAYSCAQKVIDANVFPFTDLTKVTAGKDQTFSTEHVFALTVQDLQSVYNELMVGGGGNVPPLLNIPVDSVNLRYENRVTDYRYISWKAVGDHFINTKFQQTAFGLSDVNVSGQMPLIRLSEMYYILAETALSPDAATSFLNKIREARGIKEPLPTLDPQTLRQELLKEYRKEFYAEGQIFFYYKRHNMTKIPNGPLVMSNNTYVWPYPLAETEYGN